MPLLGKIRAGFAVAGPLFLAGKSQSSIKVYMRIVNEILQEDKRTYFTQKGLKSLEENVKEAKEFDDVDESARLIRKGLENVYDALIDHYCGLNGVSFNPAHEKITRSNELCRPLIRTRRFADCVRIFRKVAEDLLADTSLSQTAHKRLQDAVEFSLDCKDQSEANLKLRKGLDYVYDELRLPEIYSELPIIERQDSDSSGDKVVIFGKKHEDEGLAFDVIYLNDRVIAGESSGEFLLTGEGCQLGVFKGSIKFSNQGGFASFRLFPKDDFEFKERTRGCKGFVISIKNLSNVELRPKMQLSSERNARAFNWQCGFTLPASRTERQVYLPLQDFWPTIFGHSLAHSGNVRLDYVDSIGLILSKIEENGSCNRSFEEGEFCLQIEWICAVKKAENI